MADPDYRLYNPDPDSNTAASPIGAPEGGYQGRWVNDTLRWLMATVRRLGDSVPKVDGDDFNGDNVIRALAFRDAILPADIAGFPGLVPVGGIVPFWGTLTAAVALEARGWQVCDGRVSTIAGTTYTAPDLRGRFPLFTSSVIAPQATGGSLTTATDGGGTTGSTTLTLAQVPTGLMTDWFSDNHTTHPDSAPNGIQQDFIVVKNPGGGQGHTHTTPAHSHVVNPPPYAGVIPLLRIF